MSDPGALATDGQSALLVQGRSARLRGHARPFHVAHELGIALGMNDHFANQLRRRGDTFRITGANAESASGSDLSWFFDEWVRGVGYPIYQADWGVTDQPAFVNLCLVVETALPPRALRS